jgi:hypothetical protein
MSNQITNISEVAISLPFTITQFGTISATTDQNKIWADRVLSVIGTGFYERILNPTFGSTLYTALYNNTDSSISNSSAVVQITNSIKDAFITFLPLLSLQDVKANFDSNLGVLSIEIIYQLPNQKTSTLTIGSVSINGNTPPTERR